MDYCKITASNQVLIMPNPYHLTIANPTEAQKAIIAEFDNWLEMVYTEPPTYNPETHYITDYWQEENGKAVQHWEVHELPEAEATAEDYEAALNKLGVEV